MSVPYQKSRIFIQNVTVLDCAVWDVNIGPVGRSWNVDVEWSGTTDDECVVIDFSTAKKLAKNIIDDLFDHRLLIADTVTTPENDGRIICAPHNTTPITQRFLIDTYKNSLVVFEQDLLIELSMGRTTRLEDAISREILSQSPSNVTEVKIRLREHQNRSEPFFLITYIVCVCIVEIVSVFMATQMLSKCIEMAKLTTIAQLLLLNF